MNPTTHLIIHNVITAISSITILGLALFIYLNGPKKPTNILFSLFCLAASVFTISHIIGTNISDPESSRVVLMLNISVFYVGLFNLHGILYLIGKEQQNRRLIYALYAIALFFTIFFIIRSDLFLLPSVPKMYFPSYYNPGILNWVRVAYLYGISLPCMTYFLATAYRSSIELTQKRQYMFLLVSTVVGYLVGFIPNFLVYNIQIDPLIGMTCTVIYAVPFVYGAVKYGLLNVRVIAQQAFWYAIAVSIAGGLITFFNYSSQLIGQAYPNFPIWSLSLGSAVLVVTVSVFIWYKLRQSDILKYEFITTVTHKFRTPLTHIKWASENLSKENLPPNIQEQIGYIQSANVSLVELTNLLMNVSEAEVQDYEYKIETADLTVTAEETIARVENQFKAKNVHVVKNMTPGKFARYDVSRIRFVIQTFLENAVHYSTNRLAINIMIVREGDEIRCSVTDNGIGIPQEERPFLFQKFYRGHRARLTDTEGMGIGLFMAKEIIEHHHGRIWAESHGAGLGSTFSFALPTAS